MRFPGHHCSLRAFAPRKPFRLLGLQPLSESVLIRLSHPSRFFSTTGPRKRLAISLPQPIRGSRGPPHWKPASDIADCWPKTGTMALVQPGWQKGSLRDNPKESGPGDHIAWSSLGSSEWTFDGFGCPESIPPSFSVSPLISFWRTTPSSVFSLGGSIIKPLCPLPAKRRTWDPRQTSWYPSWGCAS